MQAKKLLPSEQIKGSAKLTLGDFWSWAYSDVLNNTIRPIFAEFIVGAALNVTTKPRVEWDAYDLEYQGKRIEVKCSSYIQSWEQNRHSYIRFDIAKKYSWFAKTNTYSTELTRPADCYVFCLYSEKDQSKVDVLDLSAWRFYVLSQDQINHHFGNQKTIALSRV